MLRIKNIYKRNITIGGILVEPGKIRLVPEDSNYKKFLARGWIEVFRENVKIYERGQLKKKKMKKLREIGNVLDAKDTKKSELIDEIIEKQE